MKVIIATFRGRGATCWWWNQYTHDLERGHDTACVGWNGMRRKLLGLEGRTGSLLRGGGAWNFFDKWEELAREGSGMVRKRHSQQRLWDRTVWSLCRTRGNWCGWNEGMEGGVEEGEAGDTGKGEVWLFVLEGLETMERFQGRERRDQVYPLKDACSGWIVGTLKRGRGDSRPIGRLLISYCHHNNCKHLKHLLCTKSYPKAWKSISWFKPQSNPMR